MDRAQKLKLSNTVSMMILKHDFPNTGKVNVSIDMVGGQPDSVDIKNVSSRTKKGEK